MKNIYYALGLSLASLLTSCSSEFLENNSHDTGNADDIFATTDKAKSAINGISKLMMTSYTYTTTTGTQSTSWNGEGSIKLTYGNYMGNHTVVGNKNAFGVLYQGTSYMSNITSVYDYFPWSYYYKLIDNANIVIERIDEAKGSQDERNYIKAQALTYRAYSHFMLSQIYAKRWISSNDGASRGVILKLKSNYDAQPASTLKDVYAQVYQDLNTADSLFSNSNVKRDANDYYTPDLTVARAIWARVALTKGDYEKAAEKAAEARVGHKLMDTIQYKSGFNTPNSEWILGSYSGEEQNINQYSFFAHCAYNSKNYTTAPTLISKALYDKIPQSDVRRGLFLNGEGYEYTKTGNTFGFAAVGSALYKKAFTDFPDIRGNVYAYMQFKFKSTSSSGDGMGCLNHIRTSEMYLIEAEAKCLLNEEEDAKDLLYELIHDSNRDPLYVRSTATQQELFDEIKLYRAIELWGEGFDWFDAKRWGDKIERKGIDDGGNFYGKLIFTVNPTDNNNWCWVFPQLESDYNDQITNAEE